MKITNKSIDGGKAFDWGKTSVDYAKYRDIYPPVFYEKIVKRGLCLNGQRVLDLGTGTGVLPRNMFQYGAQWTGTDISENQVKQAKLLAKRNNMDIDFMVTEAETIDFPNNTFDVITACQCFWYFNHKILMPNIARILKSDGKLLILYMAWLPFEDDIAGQSERLVLKYSPKWSGAGETRKPISIPDIVYDYFKLVEHEEYDLDVLFTRESWNGRLKACRGIGASLTETEISEWEKEHMALLEKIAPDEFHVKHYAALAVLEKKS